MYPIWWPLLPQNGDQQYDFKKSQQSLRFESLNDGWIYSNACFLKCVFFFASHGNTHITSHEQQFPPSHLSSWYPKVPPNRPSNPGRRDQSQDCRATTTTDGSLSHFNGVGWLGGWLPWVFLESSLDGSENRGFPPKSSHFKRVFHYFHHPFWGNPYFWKYPHGVMENDCKTHQIWKALLAGP